MDFQALKSATSHLKLSEVKDRARTIWGFTSSAIVAGHVHNQARDKILRDLIQLLQRENEDFCLRALNILVA